MSELLGMYWVSIAGATALAAGLALLGVQLAARDRALQTLCVGQGALLGVLLGLGLTHSVLAEWQIAAGLPFGLALPAAAGIFLLSERLVAARAVSRNTYFAALLALLLAAGGLLSAVFPVLESRLTQRFFGDLATVSESASWALVALGLALAGGLTLCRRELTRTAFQGQLLGLAPAPRAAAAEFWLGIATLATICFAVQTAGLLFTLGCLFLPTSLLAPGRRQGLAFHLGASAASGALGTGLGFLLALAVPRLPTVPLVLASVAAVSGLASLSCRGR